MGKTFLNPFLKKKVNDYDLEVRDNGDYDFKKGKYIEPTKYAIGTQSDESVGMHFSNKGKSGKEYVFSHKQLDEVLHDDNKLNEIANDLNSD